MNPQQFQETVAADPHLSDVLGRVAGAGQTRQLSAVIDAAAVALLFPVAQYVLTRIGLPWLYELKRYSELQRQKLHAWIDAQYREQGFDPDKAEAAGDALMQELEQTTAAAAQGSWERLKESLAEGSDSE